MKPKKKILIADDTLPLRVMLEEVLTDAGYEVYTAGDGLEAWEFLSNPQNQIDLLVLDLLMPRMSGFEVLRRIKEEGKKNFYILVISGVFRSSKEILKLKELGADGYLSKASVVDEILYRVNSIFYRHLEKKRRHPRVIYNLPVEFQFNSHRHSSYTTTISLGGCFIRTLKPAPEGAHITIWLTLPESKKQICGKARVAWVNLYDENRKPNALPGMGVEFISLAEEDQKLLKQIIEKKLKEEAIWQT